MWEADFERIVVVADLVDPRRDALPIQARDDLELTERPVLDALLAAVRAGGREVLHYQSPRELGEHAAEHGNDLVLSIYGGSASRNRMLLTPAVCESFGLAYVGLDTYGRALAQDKEASKALARDCGLLTPMARVIRSSLDLSICDEFPLPYVVKPLLEGSSIGITQNNLIRKSQDGRRVASRLLSAFGPVMIERYIAGREISFTAIESVEGDLITLTEIAVDGDPDYFRDHLFDADEKLHRRLPRKAIAVNNNLVSPADWIGARTLLRAVGHYGYARIDGRVDNGRFHFIELTPDAFIGPLGQMAAGFLSAELTYADFIAMVLRSVDAKQLGQPASDLRTAGNSRGR